MSEFKWMAIGTVTSLHMHPLKSGRPMTQVKSMKLIQGIGIEGAVPRTYDHRPLRMKGDEDPALRQFSIIHNDQIEEYKHALGSAAVFPPGSLRSNAQMSLTITPDELLNLLGHHLRIGPIVTVLLTIRRDPCRAMERISKGAMEIMSGGRQGVFGTVVASGEIFDNSIVYCSI